MMMTMTMTVYDINNDCSSTYELFVLNCTFLWKIHNPIVNVFSTIGCSQMMMSVSLSVHPSMTLCIIAKWYILRQKCQNKWIGSAPYQHDFTAFNPLHLHCPLSLSTSWTIDVTASDK